MLVSSYITSLSPFQRSPLQRVGTTISQVSSLLRNLDKQNISFLALSLLVHVVEIIAADGMAAFHEGRLPPDMQRIYCLRTYLDENINNGKTHTNSKNSNSSFPLRKWNIWQTKEEEYFENLDRVS